MLVLMFFCWACFCVVAQAEEEAKPFKTYSPHSIFSFQLPADWVQIPQKALAEVAQKIKEVMSPDAPPVEYIAGYQLGGKTWFSYPYLLVQVIELGRVPDEELKKLKSFQPSLDKAGRRLVEGAPSLSSLSIGEAVYDSSAQIIWGSMSSVIAGVGRVRSLNAVVLTASGAVNIYTYSREEEFETYAPLFEDIVRSVKLKSGAQYLAD